MFSLSPASPQVLKYIIESLHLDLWFLIFISFVCVRERHTHEYTQDTYVKFGKPVGIIHSYHVIPTVRLDWLGTFTL